jgi:hypothetical protein
MITCFIRYKIDLNKLIEFEEYAHTWIELVEKYGGIHHGYFLPSKDFAELPDSSFSFANIGKNGPKDIAIAIFSFASMEKYKIYKKDAEQDEKCKYITALVNKTKCILSYERNFLQPIFSGK